MPTDDEILASQEETGVTDVPAAEEQPTGETEVVETPAAEEPPKTDPTVPLAALEDERRKRQQLEQQMFQFQQQMIQQQAMLQATSQPKTSQVDVLKEIGISPDDMYSEDGVRKFAGGVQQYVKRQIDAATANIRQELESQQFNSQANDYEEVVGRMGPMGFQPAPAFQKAMQDDPALERDLLAISDPMAKRREAYRIAKMTKRIMDMEAGQAGQMDIASTVVAKTAPMSAAAVGGGGAYTKARTIAQMSDEEFARLDAEAASTA